MNPGIQYGHRFGDPPSLQKDIFTLSAKMNKILTQYKDDPNYLKYRSILDRLEVMNSHLDELITYMRELDDQERKLYELEQIAKKTYNVENKEEQDKIEIVLKDFDFDN